LDDFDGIAEIARLSPSQIGKSHDRAGMLGPSNGG
jgi:hypothetical protein